MILWAGFGKYFNRFYKLDRLLPGAAEAMLNMPLSGRAPLQPVVTAIYIAVTGWLFKGYLYQNVSGTSGSGIMRYL